MIKIRDFPKKSANYFFLQTRYFRSLMNPHFIPKKCPEKRSYAALPYERGAFSWQDMRFYGAVQPSRHAFYHAIAGFLLCTFGAILIVRPIFPGNNFVRIFIKIFLATFS